MNAELVEAQAAFRPAQGERILKLHKAGSIRMCFPPEVLAASPLIQHRGQLMCQNYNSQLSSLMTQINKSGLIFWGFAHYWG